MALRLILAVLITVNLLFAVFANTMLIKPVPDDRMGQQVAADKVVIVSRGDPPPGSAQVASASSEPEPVPNVVSIEPQPIELECTMWGGLNREMADRISELAKTQFSDLKIERKEERETKSYWVFIPDIPNRTEADRRVVELKKMGVPEYFVVQSGNTGRLSISLGIFSSESAASERLGELRDKGIKNARTGPRDSRIYFNINAYGTASQIKAWNDAGQAVVSNNKPQKCSVSAARPSR